MTRIRPLKRLSRSSGYFLGPFTPTEPHGWGRCGIFGGTRASPSRRHALLLQFAAFALTHSSRSPDRTATRPLAFALLCGLFATAFSHFAGLAHAGGTDSIPVRPSAGVDTRAGYHPSDIFLAAFFIPLLAVIAGARLRTRLPLYLSSDKVWRALEDLLPETGAVSASSTSGSGLGGC